MKTDEIKLLNVDDYHFSYTSDSSSQQMPHQFSNGEVIDATKFNENFEFLVKNMVPLQQLLTVIQEQVRIQKMPSIPQLVQH